MRGGDAAEKRNSEGARGSEWAQPEDWAQTQGLQKGTASAGEEGLQLPACSDTGHSYGLAPAPETSIVPGFTTARGWDSLPTLWSPDERRFLRVIKPCPLGTMGPYVAAPFT